MIELKSKNEIRRFSATKHCWRIIFSFVSFVHLYRTHLCVKSWSCTHIQRVEKNTHLSAHSRKNFVANRSSTEQDNSTVFPQRNLSPSSEWSEKCIKCIKLLEQLERPVSSLPGVGPKTQGAFHRLGLYTVRSLLFHFPTSFNDRSTLCKDITSLQEDELCTLIVTVENITPAPQYLRAQCLDSSGNKLSVMWFHGDSVRGKNFAIALRKSLGNTTPSRRIVSGRLKWSDNHTRAEILNPQVVKRVSEMSSVQKIEPVYKSTEGLTQKKIAQTIGHALTIGCALLQEMPELIPEEILAELSWPTLAQSLFLAHNPTADHSIKGRANVAITPSRLRIAFQELMTQHVFLEIARFRYKNTFYTRSIQQRKWTEFQQIHADWEVSPLIQMAISSLPFSLTKSQKRCLGEIWRDSVGYTGKMTRMARLLNGDVGSGKTVVAYLTALGCIEHPQLSNVVAFLCPTTLLAQQHVDTLRAFVAAMECNRHYFDSGHGSIRKIHVKQLTSAVVGIKRDKLLDQLVRCSNDEAVIIVGTHALISDQVTKAFQRIGRDNEAEDIFPGIALAIIDEEQRLGVDQRNVLSEMACHTLYMTATPIPRTLALTRSSNILSKLTVGGLDVSILQEKPESSRNVTTSIVDINNVNDVIEGLRRQIQVGAKIFWILPVIGAEEQEQSTKGQHMTVMTRFQQLCDLLGPDMVGIVHGQMSSSDKNRQLELFADNNSNMSVIVGTTVLEVGIDIPCVTILVVEEADRFGLSQLHQLRGRIGRARSFGNSSDQEMSPVCHCVLLTDVFSPSKSSGKVARRRLDILRKSSDGKVIAEVDLMIRGPGEKVGQRQAGLTGGGWAIDLRYHWDLELPAALLGQYIVRAKSTDSDEKYEDALENDSNSTGSKVQNELKLLLQLPYYLSTQHLEWSYPNTVALLLRIHLCFFGKWDESEWNTVKALRTLHDMEASLNPDKESIMKFLNMAEKIMSTNLPISTPSEPMNLNREETKPPLRRTLGPNIFKSDNAVFLVVDIETTGLNPKADYVIQLAAKVIGSRSGFSKYILPPIRLSETIENITGITNKFLWEGGKDSVTGFNHKGRAEPFRSVFDDFCSFCRGVSKLHGKPLVMIAHNCAFDLRMIHSEMKRNNRKSEVSQFPSFSRDTGIVSAVDSLVLLRNKEVWKKVQTSTKSWEKRMPYPPSYSLEAIHRHMFGMDMQHGHNAINDVLALEKILLSSQLNDWKPIAEKIQLSLVFDSSDGEQKI